MPTAVMTESSERENRIEDEDLNDDADQFNGDYIGAEMLKAFITCDEYRKRFGS